MRFLKEHVRILLAFHHSVNPMTVSGFQSFRNLYRIQCRRIIPRFLNLVWELFSQKNPASTSLTYNYSKAYKNVCAKSDLPPLSIHCKELKHLFLSHGSRVGRYVCLIKYKYSSTLICVFLYLFPSHHSKFNRVWILT